MTNFEAFIPHKLNIPQEVMDRAGLAAEAVGEDLDDYIVNAIAGRNSDVEGQMKDGLPIYLKSAGEVAVEKRVREELIKSGKLVEFLEATEEFYA